MLPSTVNACRQPRTHRLQCGRTWNTTGALSLESLSQRLFFLSQKVGNVPSDSQYHQQLPHPKHSDICKHLLLTIHD